MIGQFDRLFLCFIIDSLKNKTQGTNKKDSSYKLKHGKNKIRCPADSCLLSKRSEQGRYLAASRSLMSRFEDVDDPRLIALWREKGDIKNVDGKYHFRTVAIENVPHTTTHLMHILTWAWARRFARNLETDEVIKLYDI